MLKIYTRNIFGVPFVAPDHHKRIELIYQDIIAYSPDIVFFEEFFLLSDISYLTHITENYTIIRDSHDFFDLAGGLIALIKKEIQFTHTYTKYSHSGLLTDLSIVDKVAQKGYQTFTLNLPKCKTIHLIHTHLTCPYGDINKTDISRLITTQLEELQSYTSHIIDPVFLLGDLNIEPKNSIFKQFIKKAHWTDFSYHIRRTYRGNFYIPAWLFKKSTDSKKIDYVLGKNTDNLKVHVSALHDTEFKSDHFALITHIRT